MLQLSRFLALLALLLYTSSTQAQNYVDVLKIHFGSTLPAQFENSDEESTIQTLDVSLTYPIKMSERFALLTGVDFGRYHLYLFPRQQTPTSLYSTTLKLGANIKHSEKWSGTYVLLPKLVADYKKVGSADFQMGGAVLLKYKMKENLALKLGLYSSTEAFGLFMTPILGVYYQSLNKKLEVNVTLPSSGDVNYELVDWLTIGGGFAGRVRSYNLSDVNAGSNLFYTHRNSTDVLGYFRFNLLKKSLLLKTVFGYSINDFSVYDDDEKIDLGLATLEFGNERTQLNPDLKNNLFLQLGLIYRFHL